MPFRSRSNNSRNRYFIKLFLNLSISKCHGTQPPVLHFWLQNQAVKESNWYFNSHPPFFVFPIVSSWFSVEPRSPHLLEVSEPCFSACVGPLRI
jgi:hypothetical protein